MTEKEQKFYQLTLQERLQALQDSGGLSAEEADALSGAAGLTPAQADHMIENVVGTFALPLGNAH